MNTSARKELSLAVAELLRLVCDLSYKYEDTPFKLSSGGSSHHFIDIKPASLHPLGSKLIAKLMLEHIKDLSPDLIGGMESGGIPLVASVCALAPEHLIKGAFFVRKQPKGHGTNKLIDGMFYNGANVVLIEDVTTTGSSILKAAAAVREGGGRVSHILTVVDREEGAQATLKKHNLTLIPLLTLSDIKNIE